MSIFTNKSKNSSSLTNRSKNSNIVLCDSYSESNQNIQTALYSGSYIKAGQSFAGDGDVLGDCKFYTRKVGSPTGNAVATIYAHTGTFGTDGTPDGVVLATSDNFDVSTLTTSFALTDFNFTGIDKIKLTKGTNYFVILEYSGGDISNRIEVGCDITPSHAGNGAYYDSSWTDDNAIDYSFYVYTSLIANRSKNSTSLTNKTKISTSLTNKAKVSTTFTNKS